MIDYGTANKTGRSYRVGALMFATLFDLVGQQEFNQSVGGFYQRFGSGGSTKDFIDFAKRTSSHDLTRFFDDWLLTTRWVDVLANATSISDLAAHYRPSSRGGETTSRKLETDSVQVEGSRVSWRWKAVNTM
jgi:hypothetical protein